MFSFLIPALIKHIAYKLYMPLHTAIDKVITDFPNSHRVQIINNLPEKYHSQYWVNCFNEDFLFKTDRFFEFNYYPNIKEINKRINSLDIDLEIHRVSSRKVSSFLKKIKKEEEQLKKIYRDMKLDYNRMLSEQQAQSTDYGSKKDDGITVDLSKDFGGNLVVDNILEERKKK